MSKVLAALIGLLACGYLAYAYYDDVERVAMHAYHRALPCTTPLSYSLVGVDERFGLEESEVLEAVRAATEVWETMAQRDLFARRPDGGLISVRFIYDDRQATTDTLTELGLSIENDSRTYAMLEARYAELLGAYESAKAAFERARDDFERDVDAYEREVARWNARGGAPRDEYTRLRAEKDALDTRRVEVEALADAADSLAAEVNALVPTLNELAERINTRADAYRETGDVLDEEFEEAVFVSGPSGAQIDVYEFDSPSSLRRVLAHELGHALGLEHVEDEDAIMYRLNEGDSEEPTEADIAELARACGLE